MSVTVTGLGSGFDIDALVKAYVDAEKVPKETLLNIKEEKLTAEVSAFGVLKSHTSSLERALNQLKDPAKYGAKGFRMSVTEYVTPTVSQEAAEGTHSVRVNSLAAAGKVATPDKIEIYSADLGKDVQLDTILHAQGRIKVEVNGIFREFEITDDMTLKDVGALFDNLNLPGDFVKPTVMMTGSGARLILTGEATGAANDVQVSVLRDDNPTGTRVLSQLFDASGRTFTLADGSSYTSKLEILTTASDAEVLFDGIRITATTNTLENVVPGIDLDLLKADSSITPFSINIFHDQSDLTQPLYDFVDAYNQIRETIKEYTKFDQNEDKQGVLLGDYLLRTFENQIQLRISPRHDVSLASMGITYDLDGKLEIDRAKLTTSLADSSLDIKSFFIDSSVGWVTKMTDVTRSFLQYNGSFDSRVNMINESLDQIEKDRTTLLERIAVKEAMLFERFNAMDAILGQLNQLTESIKSMLDNLPMMTANKKD